MWVLCLGPLLLLPPLFLVPFSPLPVHRRFCLGLPAPTYRLDQPGPASLTVLLTAIPFALWPPCFVSPPPDGTQSFLGAKSSGSAWGSATDAQCCIDVLRNVQVPAEA